MSAKRVEVYIDNQKFIGDRISWSINSVSVDLSNCPVELKDFILKSQIKKQHVKVSWKVEGKAKKKGYVERLYESGNEPFIRLTAEGPSYAELIEDNRKYWLNATKTHASMDKSTIEPIKVNCSKCGFSILESTAIQNKGMCAVCVRGGEGPGFLTGTDSVVIRAYEEFKDFVQQCVSLYNGNGIEWCDSLGKFESENSPYVSPGEVCNLYFFMLLGFLILEKR